QGPQETNAGASSDASTALETKIKSRVSNRGEKTGWLLSLASGLFDRDLLIFVTKWTLACLVGASVGFAVGRASLWGTRWGEFYWSMGWNGFAGATVGVTQWFVLRRRIGSSQWWIPFTTIGWITAGIIAGFFGSWTTLPYGMMY